MKFKSPAVTVEALQEQKWWRDDARRQARVMWPVCEEASPSEKSCRDESSNYQHGVCAFKPFIR